MLCKIIKPNFQHRDERGGLTQLVREGYKQVNYVYSKAGCIRGDHYHDINTETFYIIRGKFTIALEYEGEKEEHCFKEGDMFQVPPKVKHTFHFIEDTELIGLYDCGVELENGEKDIYR